MDNTATTNTNKTAKRVVLGLSALLAGALAFFGIRKLKKNNTDENKDVPGSAVDTEDPVQTPAGHKPRTTLPAGSGNAAFPLAPGTKGPRVKSLQEALIRKFGATILPRFGADAQFGTELTLALRAKGYQVPLAESDYNTIVQTKEEDPLKTFDPPAVAKALHTAIATRDFTAAITLLKSFGSPGNYALVSEHFKQLFLFGVRRSIANAMLGLFTQPDQKAATRKALLDIGLKYDAGADKWSLSGLGALNGPVTKIKEGDVVATTKEIMASATHANYFMIPAGIRLGKVNYILNDIAYINTSIGSELRVRIEHLKKINA